MRNAIYSGIVGLVVGILVGVYGIAPDTDLVVTGSEKEETFRESDVKEVAASAERKQKIFIGTSNRDSPYFAAGAGICRFLKRSIEKHGITCLVENTSGSAFNIINILQADRPGKLTMGVAQSVPEPFGLSFVHAAAALAAHRFGQQGLEAWSGGDLWLAYRDAGRSQGRLRGRGPRREVLPALYPAP